MQLCPDWVTTLTPDQRSVLMLLLLSAQAAADQPKLSQQGEPWNRDMVYLASRTIRLDQWKFLSSIDVKLAKRDNRVHDV